MALQEERMSLRPEEKGGSGQAEAKGDPQLGTEAEQAGATLLLPLLAGSRDLSGSGSPPPPEPPPGSTVPLQPCRSLQRRAQRYCTGTNAAGFVPEAPGLLQRRPPPGGRYLCLHPSPKRGGQRSAPSSAAAELPIGAGGSAGREEAAPEGASTRGRRSSRRRRFWPSLKPSRLLSVAFAVPPEDAPPLSPRFESIRSARVRFLASFGAPGVKPHPGDRSFVWRGGSWFLVSPCFFFSGGIKSFCGVGPVRKTKTCKASYSLWHQRIAGWSI